MKTFFSYIENELVKLKSEHGYRTLMPPLGYDFCSNDYLGLANNDKMKQACSDYLLTNELGSTSSRYIRGDRDIFTSLEKDLAHFKQTDSALLFSCGYMANIGVISALIKKDYLVFSDQKNHASIIDGIKLSGASLAIYKHIDVDDLHNKLKNAPKDKTKFLITESLFSMDGDIAPLDVYADLAKKYNLLLLVDECHGVGIFGNNYSGLIEYFGINDAVTLSINGLGKAFGVYGAFIAGSSVIIDFIKQKARSLIFTTALPPMLAEGIKEALHLIQKGDRQHKLFLNMDYLYRKLSSHGLIKHKPIINTPIIPIILKENEQVLYLAYHMGLAGFDIKAIRPPSVPVNEARLRITANINHNRDLIDTFIASLTKLI